MRAAAAVLCLALLGCAEDAESPAQPTPTQSPTETSPSPTEASPTEQSPTQKSPTEAADGTEVVVAESDFGPMLFDAADQAIYLFDVETTDRPRCYDDCAEAWPPVLTDGEPVAGDGVDAALLGTTRRTDGTTQVTYGGHPLYYYAHEGPGEVLCHDVFLNGGNWYVVQPDGTAAPSG